MRRFHRSVAEVKMWRSPSERSERRALRRVKRRTLPPLQQPVAKATDGRS